MSIIEKNEFDLYEYYALLSSDEVILSYKGPINNILLAEFSKDIREKMQKDAINSKKVFAIFMEMTTNVLYYSREKNHFAGNERVGMVVITQTEKYYRLMTGNLIRKSASEILMEKCNKINSLDREALREYKRILRNEPPGEESQGAGIGLVQIALTADNAVQIRIKEINDQFSFFIIYIDVLK